MSESYYSDFFVYDNVAVFPASVADSYPQWTMLIKRLPTTYVGNVADKVIVSCVASKQLITKDSFDSIFAVLGYAVLDLTTKNLDFISAHDAKWKLTILNTIVTKIEPKLTVTLPIGSVDFDDSVNYFAKYGFVHPRYDENNAIVMTYRERISTKTTIDAVTEILTTLKSNVHVLMVFMSKTVAQVLSKCVKFPNEVSGNLSITKYTDSGAAILGVNTDNIFMGGPGQVETPQISRPFAFHSHPDAIIKDFNAFIAWPSGGDMAVVVSEYLRDRDQLGHFVASPEGLWVIKITPEFQNILKPLKSVSPSACTNELLAAIANVYGNYEHDRYTNIDPLQRHNAGQTYISKVKTYKVSNLINDLPDLARSCNILLSHDATLFNVDYIKWKQFDDAAQGVMMTFAYIPDPSGGLPVHIEPYD
jgi:hypothetical protein